MSAERSTPLPVRVTPLLWVTLELKSRKTGLTLGIVTATAHDAVRTILRCNELGNPFILRGISDESPTLQELLNG